MDLMYASNQIQRLRFILGDQLNERHSWFQEPDSGTLYIMAEMRQETDYVTHHAQKVLGIFAAMRLFAERLRGLGHRVHYLPISDPNNLQAEGMRGGVSAVIRLLPWVRIDGGMSI